MSSSEHNTTPEKSADGLIVESLNVDELCRLCMEKRCEMVDVVEINVSQKSSIPHKMKTCLSINADVEDGMPPKVCCECLEALNKSAQFRKRCKKVDQILRHEVKRNKMLQQAQELYGPGYIHLEAEDKIQVMTLPSDTVDCLITSTVSDVDRGSDEDGTDGEEQFNQTNVGMLFETPNNELGSHDGVGTQTVATEEITIRMPNIVADKPKTDDQGEDGEYGEVETLIEEDEDVIRFEDIKIEAIENSEGYEDSNGAVEVQVSLDGESYVVEVLGKTSTAGLGLRNPERSPPKMDPLERRHKGYKLPVPEVLVVDVGNQERRLAYRCPECQKVFDNRNLYRRHASSHIDTIGMACKYCNKWFPIKSSLKRHERIHSGDKPYLCLLCNRSFTQKEILRRHVLTHSDSKPFKCKHCDKSYTQKEALKVHIKNNHTVRNTSEIDQYPCALCDKAFCHPSGLSRHLQSHTGKRYPCKYCPSVFTDSSSLKRHMLKLHPKADESTCVPTVPNNTGPCYSLLINNVQL